MRTQIKTCLNFTVNSICRVSPIVFIRFANALFVSGYAYTMTMALFESDDTYFYKLNIADLIWHLHDKLLIFTLYLGLLIYVRNTIVRWEVFIVCGLCFLRLCWQVWSTFDFQNANSYTTQFALSLLANFLVIYLVLWRTLVYFFHKNEDCSDVADVSEENNQINDEDIMIG